MDCNILKIIPLEERIVLDASIYVDAQAAPGGDGSTWAQAYTDLHAALTQAAGTSTAETIHVADGIYTPSTTSRAVFFTIPDLTTLIGGYGGTTILSGDILGNDITDRTNPGYVASHLDNSLKILNANSVSFSMQKFTVYGGYNETITALGAGLTVTNVGGSHTVNLDMMVFDDNYVNGQDPTNLPSGLTRGGPAIHMLNDITSSPTNSITATITQSIFSNNYTQRVGAGIHLLNVASVTIDHTVFDHNQAVIGAGNGGVFGGAAKITMNFAADSVVNISHSTFSNNSTAVGAGGALVIQGYMTSTIDHTLFYNNEIRDRATGSGAALWTSSTLPTYAFHISNSQFIDNHSLGFGGAIYMLTPIATTNSSLSIDHTVFDGNTANPIDGQGGVMFLNLKTVQISYSHFNNNSAASGGAVSASRQATAILNLSIDHSLFTNNSATIYGGAIVDRSSVNLTVTDTHFFNNTAAFGGAVAMTDALNNAALPVTVNRFANFSDNLFKFNSATNGGAVALIDTGGPFINERLFLNLTSNIVYFNTATALGGAYYQSSGTATITENSFHQNLDPNNDEFVIDLPSTVNGEVTAMQIVAALVDDNKKLSSDEILVLP